jgi:hypothetical protein
MNTLLSKTLAALKMSTKCLFGEDDGQCINKSRKVGLTGVTPSDRKTASQLELDSKHGKITGIIAS